MTVPLENQKPKDRSMANARLRGSSWAGRWFDSNPYTSLHPRDLGQWLTSVIGYAFGSEVVPLVKSMNEYGGGLGELLCLNEDLWAAFSTDNIHSSEIQSPKLKSLFVPQTILSGYAATCAESTVWMSATLFLSFTTSTPGPVDRRMCSASTMFVGFRGQIAAETADNSKLRFYN